jgi:Phasin protein
MKCDKACGLVSAPFAYFDARLPRVRACLSSRRREAEMGNHKTEQREPMNNEWMPGGTDAWWSAMSEYQSEVLDFMAHRLAKDSHAVRELGECQNWRDVADLQSKWVEDTFRDYSKEATKIMAIYAKQGSDAERRVRH